MPSLEPTLQIRTWTASWRRDSQKLPANFPARREPPRPPLLRRLLRPRRRIVVQHRREPALRLFQEAFGEFHTGGLTRRNHGDGLHRTDNRNAGKGAEHEEVLISRDNEVGPGCRSQGEYVVVIWISADRFRERWRVNDFRQQPYLPKQRFRIGAGSGKHIFELRTGEDLGQLGEQ